MNRDYIRELLQKTKEGSCSVDEALLALQGFPFTDIGHTKIDTQRQLRNGFPEVIYGENKTPQQVCDIFEAMLPQSNVLATRVSEAAAAAVCRLSSDVEYNPLARTLIYSRHPLNYAAGKIVIVTAGTSDLPVAEEARVTADMLGNPTELITDVGVAGIHRLFDRMENIRDASVIIVCAGMEGALSSVIGGLVDIPLIAVPTSVGYGAGFGGIAALLGMLTSCASGITVVNIDNGFGAACAASRINHAIHKENNQ